MTTELKTRVIDAAHKYMAENGLSNNDMCRITGLTKSYLSHMLRHKTTLTVNNVDVVIADKYYKQLADFIDIGVDENKWPVIPTRQFTQILAALKEAKETGRTAMIISNTGMGKTHAVERFTIKNPLHTYKITVSEFTTLNDIVKQLIGLLGLDETGTAGVRLKKVIDKLVELSRSGFKPVVIFDEMENARVQLIRMQKALYDGIKDHCPIVLIGTPQLTKKLDKLVSRDVDGIPQFQRRFKAGTRNIDNTLNLEAFYVPLGIADAGLKKLLNMLCNNYGELHDYLQPVIEYCTEKQLPLTEEHFRLKWNIFA